MKNIRLLSLFALLLPVSAFAHTGLHEVSGFMSGFSHPFSGLDHLLAMIAVGLWATQLGGRALWMVPMAFVSVMVVGGVLGFSGVELPFVEGGIVMSVCLLGVLVASRFVMSLIPSVLLVGVFALFHGYAHGAEMPPAIYSVIYVAGFVVATALLHIAGIVGGKSLKRLQVERLVRLVGGLIAMSGLYLALN